MDNRIGIALAATISVLIVVMAVGFSFLQGEIDSLNRPVATSSPSLSSPSSGIQNSYTSTPYNSTSAPTPTITRTTQPNKGSSHSSTIYTWYLKSEFMDNENWLKGIIGSTGVKYDSTKSWSDNYIVFISSIWEIPQFAKEAGISGLVGASLIEHLPVTVLYDNATGYTKATYQYADDIYHVIESSLSDFAVDGKWTRENV